MLFGINAICYTLKLAGQAGDNKFVKEWKDMPDKVKESFLKVFWNEEKAIWPILSMEADRMFLYVRTKSSPVRSNIVRCRRDETWRARCREERITDTERLTDTGT